MACRSSDYQDGQCQPVSVETFDLGGGFPDQNEFVMKFGASGLKTEEFTVFSFLPIYRIVFDQGENVEVCYHALGQVFLNMVRRGRG